MSFQLTEQHMRRLCQINCFPVADDGMCFFGLRGCLPSDTDGTGFDIAHEVQVADIDYTHPRCTLGQWLPGEGNMALFPGSTVPHIRYVKMSKERNGDGANQLLTGFYADYRKGIHKAGSPTAHKAFRQTQAHPIRRTADDFDFDNDDRVEFVNPYDNIHAGWSMGINHDEYASAGCQVVVGYPACPSRGSEPDIGPWREFKNNAYSLSQDRFPYVLLNGTDAQRLGADPARKVSARLRFGSEGGLVRELQQALKNAGFYEGDADGEFLDRTLRAVLAFQTSKFGPHADDGIVGPMTASALGLVLPEL
ncbi:MAG TPA: peptidoglycan-binding domain-containing protein [Geobacteraceae bacterium]